MKYFGLLLFGILLASCKKEAATDTIITEIDSTSTSASIKNPDKEANGELKKLANKFIKHRDEVIKKVSSLTPEEANRLFEDCVKVNSDFLASFNDLEGKLLESYNWIYYDDHGNPKKVPDSLRQKENILKGARLEFWEVGEGMAEIRTVPKFYREIFGKYVTPDYREYIDLNAKEDEMLFVSDAGLAVELEEAGRRVINWEKFIEKYPDSKLIKRAKSLYQYYQDAYLFGFDNTPVKDYQTREIYKDNLDDFKSFMAKYPDSPTTRLIQIVINNTDTHEELSKIINKEQENMGLDTTPYEDSE